MATLLESGAIRLVPEFLGGSDSLFAALVRGVTWDERMRARKAASFGQPYNYSGIVWPAVAFPELLLPVLGQVTAWLGDEPNNCLAHLYPDGDSTMGFHSDATDELVPGTGITVVSLGAERKLTFRHQADRTRREAYALPGGSLLWMCPEMQADWKHAVLAEDGVAGPRISLTFRRLKTG